jgi:predicted nucleotidyltransferase
VTPRDPLIERARDVLERAPDVVLGILFGSLARGEARSDSDVDIAVSFASSDVSLRRELELQGELELALGRTVDLVALDAAEPPLKWRIARDGVCLLDRAGVGWNRFRIAAAIEHDDMKYTVDRALAAQHRRLLAGAGR